MKLTKALLFAVLSVAATPLLAASFQFDTTGSEPLYRTEIPKTVYQHSRRDGLQDLTVTNASGEQVPYALIPYADLHPQSTLKHDSKPLSVYPIHEYQLKYPGELSIQFENIESYAANPSLNLKINTQVKDVKSIYLVDAGKKHPALQTLNVDWIGSEGALLPLEIRASDDLKNWSIVGHAVLLKTSADGKTLLQNNISLDYPTEARYLQIRPAEDDTLILTSINADFSHVQSLTPNILWQELEFLNREQNQKTGEINLNFESLGRYPASHLHIQLPQSNTITTVKVSVRNKTNEPWTYLTSASLYRMTPQGKTITNPDITFHPTVARYWQLQFNQANGGLGNDNPRPSIGWLPQTLIWNARGQAPFTLNIGNNPDIINMMDTKRLIPDYDTANDLSIKKIQQLPSAKLVQATNKVTKNQTSTWASAPDYKRWLLWSGLFIGILVLAGMAYALFKSERPQS